MEQLKKKKGNILMEIFDAMFIMILCFGTLLSAMLIQADEAAGMLYNINFITFGIMVLGLILYIFLVVTHSEKGLKSIIKALYTDREQH